MNLIIIYYLIYYLIIIYYYVLTHLYKSLFIIYFLISVSFQLLELARVIDTHLELNVDFKRKVLEGRAILTIERKYLVSEIVSRNYF